MMDRILGDVLAVAPFGWYISPIKIIVMLVFLTPWLYLSPWVQKDAKNLHLAGSAWSLSIIFVGVLTVFIWMVQPFFVVGLLIYVLLTGGMFIAYVVSRNSRVEDSDEKVLTIGHILGLFGTKKIKEVTVVNKLRLYHADGKIILPPSLDAEDDFREAYNMVQELLYDIVWRRASEADISPATAQARVRFVVDGVVMERPPMGLTHSEAVIQYLKRIGGMDVRGPPPPAAGQDGRRPGRHADRDGPAVRRFNQRTKDADSRHPGIHPHQAGHAEHAGGRS